MVLLIPSTTPFTSTFVRFFFTSTDLDSFTARATRRRSRGARRARLRRPLRGEADPERDRVGGKGEEGTSPEVFPVCEGFPGWRDLKTPTHLQMDIG